MQAFRTEHPVLAELAVLPLIGAMMAVFLAFHLTALRRGWYDSKERAHWDADRALWVWTATGEPLDQDECDLNRLDARGPVNA